MQVAQDLLGKILVVRSCPEFSLDQPEANVTVGRIFETEAYRGDDPASHSARGETPRCSVMFGHPGIAYVYFIYGMFEMLNFVTEPQGHAGAVLIRALQPLSGEELMMSRRYSKNEKTGKSSTSKVSPSSLMNGPGRLCQAMGIQMSHNKQALNGPSLYVCDDGYRPVSISQSPRVGIRLGKEKLWRFFIPDLPYISRVPQNAESSEVIFN